MNLIVLAISISYIVSFLMLCMGYLLIRKIDTLEYLVSVLYVKEDQQGLRPRGISLAKPNDIPTPERLKLDDRTMKIDISKIMNNGRTRS